MTLKLADFGISKQVDGKSLTGFRGTVPYMSPELLISKPYFSVKCDIWY